MQGASPGADAAPTPAAPQANRALSLGSQEDDVAAARATGQHALLACRHCDTLHSGVAVEPGGMATCRRCGYVLLRRTRHTLDFWFALSAAALVVFGIANYFPLARLTVLGKALDVTFIGALWLIWEQGHYLLAAMSGLVGFWFPLTQLCVLLWALDCLRRRRLPPDFALGLRLYHLVGPWSMVPVLMLGIIVSIVKFAGLASLQPEAGIWAFGVLTFLMTGLSRLDSMWIWRHAEEAGLVPCAHDTGLPAEQHAACRCCGYVQPLPGGEPRECARCGSRVRKRKRNMHARVWALIIAASIVYVPANVLPMMHIRSAMGSEDHTILGGVIALWRLDSWDLAIIVFIASVVVPITKLLALSVLMLGKRWRGDLVQRQRTRLYELVEFIGQWSMLDVFVVVLMAAMANFPGVSQIIAGPAAASFGMVVILTMLAALSYDPRTGWDRGASAIPGSRSHD